MLLMMAWRNVWRNPVRSLVIVAAMALGLVAGIFIMGLYEGMLQSRLRSIIDTEVGHLQIQHPKFKIDNEAVFTISKHQEIIREISELNQVAFVTARSVAHGMLATGTGSSGVQIIGVNPESENQVSRLDSKIIEGKTFTEDKRNQVLIGKKLADKMKLKVRSKLVLTFTDKQNSIVSAAFRVVGIYQSDNTPLDERNVYTDIHDMNRLLGESDDECHTLTVILKSDNDLDALKAKIQNQYPELLIESWKELSPETRLMIETTDQYSIIFIVIIMLALMFGIINTMLMAIIERSREIGMLVALGMNRIRLFLLVLWETILLTLAGVPFGFGLAWIIIQYFNQNGIDISSFAGEAMSGFGFSSMIYPEFPFAQVLPVFSIVLSTALFSSLFPSYKALRLQPVDAMRL
jgi:putative ABC transport system permease protein